jgi:hypothetical protein
MTICSILPNFADVLAENDFKEKLTFPVPDHRHIGRTISWGISYPLFPISPLSGVDLVGKCPISRQKT